MGVIVYRMLTGRKPFEGKELGDVIVKICTEAPPPALELAPELPAELEAFFDRALSKDPAGRFQTARELAGAFSAIVTAHLDLPSSSGSLSGPFRRTDDEPEAETTLRSLPPAADGGAGTLTLATSSLVPTQEPPRRYRVPLAIAAILLVVGATALFWGRGAGESGAEPAENGNAVVPRPSVEPRGDTLEPVAAESNDEPVEEGPEEPAPSASATASAAPSAKPVARPRRPKAVPPAKPSPGSGKDPILGF